MRATTYNRAFAFASIPSRYAHQNLSLDKLFSRGSHKVIFPTSYHSSTTRFLSSSARLFPEEINIIYDSKCKVCQMEIEFLARRDAKLSSASNQNRKLKMTDIEDISYDPHNPVNGGITYEKGMAAIRAVRSDGKTLKGIPVFQNAYRHVGLGWLFAFTNIQILNQLAEIMYTTFAKYRTYFTRGGVSLEHLVKAYEEKRTLEATKKNDDCEACNLKDGKKL